MISSFIGEGKLRKVDYPKLKSIIEGLLFMAGDEGLNPKQLADILELDAGLAAELVRELKEDLDREGRGVQVAEVAGAFRLTTRPEHAPYFERMAYTPTRSALSQAALETLSIVAYRQPITRVEIEEIRGVKSDRAIQSLISKDLIEETGRAEQIGRRSCMERPRHSSTISACRDWMRFRSPNRSIPRSC
ncbi:segregation and condensation protein B [Paenibacillus cisolokensis]|uniref:Segregation and condensation protein B n=1 Tax=Paenibacillus cisolokensis TaxID=1658519 RepID=A0ABQ4N118_9BACL|nr:segregation and condensation protein B [Paenibacillus cisolokensis]